MYEAMQCTETLVILTDYVGKDPTGSTKIKSKLKAMYHCLIPIPTLNNVY